MKKISLKATSLLFAATLALTTIQCTTDTSGYAESYKDLPIALTPVEAPVIPDRSLSIADCGGVADGVTKNTEAFASAIARLSEQGGGHLIVPAGIWYTGPITLESNIDLHLEAGAFILMSEDLDDYPTLLTTWEGNKAYRATSPINADGKTNISITGEGTINGSGQCWRPVKQSKTTDAQWRKLNQRGALNSKGTTWFPNERIAFANEYGDSLRRLMETDSAGYAAYVHDYGRPVMVSLVNCKNVLLQGVTFENSPAWNLHPLLCENLIIDRVNVRNPWFAQNGDGLDIESCRRVLVTGSTFDVGDDAICIKSGKDKEGRERGVPTADVLVENCTVYHGHGGFVVGSEMSGGCKDIVVRNCVFDGTDVGLRFKSTRGRGGVVENIYIDGIRMYNIEGNALIFNLYYGGKEDTNTTLNTDGTPMIPEVTEETPSFRDIYMTNVVCQSAERAALFNGLPEMPIRNIEISNSQFKARYGFEFSYVDGVNLDNVKIIAAEGGPVTLGKDCKNVNVN